VRNDKIAQLPEHQQEAASEAMAVLTELGVLENPRPGDPEEFFLLKLKDQHASPALYAYAGDAEVNGDSGFAIEVRELAERSFNHPNRKAPD
jgi:hypothetical protein